MAQRDDLDIFLAAGPDGERCEADQESVEVAEHTVESVAKYQVSVHGRVDDTHTNRPTANRSICS